MPKASLRDYPYGKVLRSMNLGLGADAAKYKSSGKELDTETNLSYFGARYYEGDIGRWWSVDPLTDFAIAQSPFTYVNNNPLNLIDIGGLFPNEFGQESKQEEEETYPFVIPGPPIIVEAEAPSFLPFWWWIYNPSLCSYFYQRVKGTFNANWAVNIFGPKATQWDPWWWRAFRGTGDLEQDVPSFFYGAWGITFAGIGIAVTSTILPAATTTVGNWALPAGLPFKTDMCGSAAPGYTPSNEDMPG